MSPKTGKPADTRTVSQIRADIAAARTRLSNNISGLVEDVHPTAVKGRAIDDAKNFAKSEVDYAKGLIRNDAGWRTDRLVIVGGAVVGAVVLLLTVRAIVGRVGASH